MKIIRNLQFHNGTREELLPGFDPGFPYIATRAEIDRYAGRFAPWHWHRSVELFYMESGTLEYFVPGKHLVFPAGSGGFVNSNVLHPFKRPPLFGPIARKATDTAPGLGFHAPFHQK